MDVGTNKTRKDTRAVVSLVARYRSPSTFEYVEEACCDVSLGGMFIRSAAPAAAGTLLKLECENGVGAQIRGVARVVWLRTEQNEYGPSGMGVKFVKLDPESRDLITRIVQELAEAGLESPSMSSAPEQRGKPKSQRPTSSKPAPAASTVPQAAEQSAKRPRSSGPPQNDVAVLPRTSDRPRGTPPPPKPKSSQPPSLPAGISSRPAPSNALLARANVEPIEVEPAAPGSALARTDAVTDESVLEEPPLSHDLAPLQAMVRASNVSSAPPAEERSGRAFWLVAGSVVVLGALVAVFSLRTARTSAPEPTAQDAVAVDPSPSPPAADDEVPAPSGMDEAELPSALPGTTDETSAPAADAPTAARLEDEDPEQATSAVTTPGDQAQPEGARPEAASPSAPSQPETVAAESAESERIKQPSADSPQPAAPAAPAKASSPTTPAPSAPKPVTRPASEDVPVLRIVPAGPAPASSSEGAPAAPPSAAAQAAAKPSTPAVHDNAAASGKVGPSADAQPQPEKTASTLPPGELPRVIMFTSRPSGATVYVGDQSVETPGELNLGAMPPRLRVTARKEGFESSTVWINNTSEFQKVSGVMRREVHFVLPTLPAPSAAAPAAASAPQATESPAGPESSTQP